MFTLPESRRIQLAGEQPYYGFQVLRADGSRVFHPIDPDFHPIDPEARKIRYGLSSGQYATKLKLTLAGGQPTPYWAWLPTGSNEFTMTRESREALDLDFPRGVDLAEKAGLGQAVNVCVEL